MNRGAFAASLDGVECKGDSAACVSIIMPIMVGARWGRGRHGSYLTLCDLQNKMKIMLDKAFIMGENSLTYYHDRQEAQMTDSKDRDAKIDALRRKGALNRNPERVTDQNFRTNEFFDPQDLVQVKYEMLRQVRNEGKAVSAAARTFGMSRFCFYQAQSSLERDGLPGLAPKKPGPRNRSKLTPEVLAYIESELVKDPSLRVQDVLELVKNRFRLTVHRRSVERALDVAKKKRR